MVTKGRVVMNGGAVVVSAGRAWLLGALGCAAWLAAFPPLSLWPLALLAPWPLALLAMEAPNLRAAFRRLLLCGLVVFCFGSAWLAETSPVNLVLVAALQSLFVGIFGVLARRILPGRSAMPLLPVLWVAHEMLRLNWPLTGYPWQILGQALAESPVAVQAADLGGVLLLSFLAASGSALALSLQRGERRAAAGAAGLLLAATLYGLLRPAWLETPRPGPRLAAVQPGIEQRLKMQPSSAEERYRTGITLSLQALRAGPPVDLLVWPETMWPYPLGEGAPEDRWYGELGPRDFAELEQRTLAPLRRTGEAGERASALLLGALYHRLETTGRVAESGRPAEPGRLLRSNSAVLYDAAGQRLGHYDKHILVPAGESVPFGGWLPAAAQRQVADWILSVAGFVADLEPGPGPEVMEWGGWRFGVTICFENTYGDFNRRQVRDGAQFLVNLSNEAWFGTSTEFDHMELHSILRAVESRRALFRATNSGISCLVLPDGRRPEGAARLEVGGQDRGVAGTLVAEVPLYEQRTLYVLIGDALGWLCLGWAGLLLLLGLRSPRRPTPRGP
ncbi:MAG: apolipoprotein N-acyltransferase [Planctomycetota bacterium]